MKYYSYKTIIDLGRRKFKFVIKEREEDTQLSKRDSNAYDIKEPKETKKGIH